jgi:hypothetical protein
MIGRTKIGEYSRTIEMLMEMTDKPKKDVALLLYFLHDSQYENSDLKAMADLIINKQF